MVKTVSQWSLGMMLRCGEQFRRRVIMGERIPPGIPAARGTGVHKANEVNLKQKVDTGKDLPESDLKDAARDGFTHALRNGVYLIKEEQSEKSKLLNNGLNEAIRLTGLYRKVVAPKIKPVEVERRFQFNLKGIPFDIVGYMDIQQAGNRIDDIKTTSKSWAWGQINKEIQPVFYSLAHHKETGKRPTFFYHILVHTKTKLKPQVQYLTPDNSMYEALYERIRQFCQAVQTGTFMPANPSSWWCDPKWCGYHPTCKYVGNGGAGKWV